MYEALVKRLRELPPESFTFEIMGAMHEAADAIDQQNVIISGLNETIKMYANETPQWIPVTERLPKYGTTVLVYRFSDRSQSWRVTTSTLLSYGDWTLSNVTHWMPLPTPPAVDTEEQP